MLIDRCPRTGLTFCDLIDEARAEGTGLIELLRLLDATGCDHGCYPYIRRAFRTGQTTFAGPLCEADEPPADASDTQAHRPLTHA